MKPYLDRLIVGLGVLLRLYNLGYGDAWHDEAFTGIVAPLPWAQFWPALWGDVHPPGWYVITRPFVLALPHGEAALRLPACICGVLALLLFYRYCCKHAEGPTGRAALTLLAVSPFMVYYSQEARMYGAMTLVGVLLLVALAEDLPAVFAGAAVAACWLHNLGVVVVAAGVLALLTRGWPTARWRRWGAVGLALAAPALIWTAGQALRVSAGYWIVDKSVGAWLYNALYCPLLGQGMIGAGLSWNAALAALGLALPAAALGVTRRRWDWLALAFAPGLLMLAVSNLVRPMLLARTLIASAPALYLLVGDLVGASRRRQIVAGLLLAPLLISGLLNHYTTSRRGDMSIITDAIEAEAPAVVIHSQTGGYVVLSYHMPGQNHALWAGAAAGLSNAISQPTQDALNLERYSLDDAPRPAAVVYSDYALISPEERTNMLADLDAAGAELVAVLAEDEYQRIDLWMLY